MRESAEFCVRFGAKLVQRTGQFQVQVCLVTERAISRQMHLSLVLKAFGSLISLMS